MREITAPPAAGLDDQARPRLVTRMDIRERLGISDDKLYGLIRDGDLKPPFKLGSSSRWLESDLEEFIARLVESRQPPVTPPGIKRHHDKLSVQRAKAVAAGIESKSEKADRQTTEAV